MTKEQKLLDELSWLTENPDGSFGFYNRYGNRFWLSVKNEIEKELTNLRAANDKEAIEAFLNNKKQNP